MKIKLSVLTSDERYLTKFSNSMMLAYSEKVELFLFTEKDSANEAVAGNRADIFLVDEEFYDCSFTLPKGTELVYFTNSRVVETINHHRAICKYQMVSSIYKEIVDVYAEKIAAIPVTLKANNGKKHKIITFLPAAGGVGASIAAAAYAKSLAEKGEKVLYLNLEKTGASNLYFNADGGGSFSKVIYALAMDSNTTAMKIESAISQDSSGVYFYSESSSALDMLELNREMYEQLFVHLGAISLFDWIVVDTGFSFDVTTYEQMERSYLSVFVSDGSERANYKLMRILEGLEIVAEQREAMQLNRIAVLYNRFSSRTGKRLPNNAYKELGILNRVENASERELVQLISQSELFSELF